MIDPSDREQIDGALRCVCDVLGNGVVGAYLFGSAVLWATVALRSKDEAADWAIPRLPARLRPVLARARAIYVGEEDERWDDLRADVHEYALLVAREIAVA